MSERELNEEYSKVDKRLRELTLLALLGLSWHKYTSRFALICRDWRKTLPPYIDWYSLYQGMFSSYKKYYLYLRDAYESGKPREYVDKIINSFGKFEPFAKKERKIDLRSELSNEINHHDQYETLRKELGIDGEEMREIFKDWAKLPENGGTAPYEEEIYEDQGDLFIISTHQDCSNRCLPDQGKLVSKSLDASYGLWTGKKVDGRNVYSLKAMTSRVDKYGYHNFILTGFNCRHHLHKYEGEMPHKYKFSEAREAYKEEQKAREMERKARKLNNLTIVYAKFDEEKSEAYFKKWGRLRAKYLKYCDISDIEPKTWLLK